MFWPAAFHSHSENVFFESISQTSGHGIASRSFGVILCFNSINFDAVLGLTDGSDD